MINTIPLTDEDLAVIAHQEAVSTFERYYRAERDDVLKRLLARDRDRIIEHVAMSMLDRARRTIAAAERSMLRREELH